MLSAAGAVNCKMFNAELIYVMLFPGAVISLVLLAVGFHMASLNTPPTTLVEKVMSNVSCHTHR